MTITISNKRGDSILFEKPVNGHGYTETCVLGGVKSSVTHMVPIESVAVMVRYCREKGLAVQICKA